MTRFRAGAHTDIGNVRDSNQDACLVDDSMFAVADGMGGHNGGEVASQLAIDILREKFTEPTTDCLVEAVQQANEAVVTRARSDSALRGMGTTLVVVASVVTDGEERIAIANVGDSRCYLLEDDGLRQITVDHTVVQTLVDHGQISRAEAEHHPQRNILTRALGIDTRVMADSWELLPFTGDRYVLCSDGLHGEVTDEEMAEVLRSEPNPAEAAAILVRMAKAAGGHDNISVVVVDIVEDGDATVAPESRVVAAIPGEQRVLRQTAELTPLRRSGDEGDDGRASSAGRLTFRSIMFAGALLAVVLAVVGVVAFAARSTYYVGYDASEVVIYRGRPGGVLWFDPTVERRTGIQQSDVPSTFLDELSDGEQFGSFAEAEEYVKRIEAEIASEELSVPEAPGGLGEADEPPSTTVTSAPGAGPSTTVRSR